MKLRIFDFFRQNHGRKEGFVWVANSDDGPMCAAEIGKAISVEGRGPPWIAVDHAIGKMLIASWPGKLWRVKILDAASSKDQNWQVPNSSANYTRAVSVEILTEEAASRLFGPNGDLVSHVLNAASRLTKSEAVQLAQSRHSNAASIYDSCFRSWLAKADQARPYSENLDGVLQIYSGGTVSPVGYGLSLAYRCVFDRAVEIDGGSATDCDDEDVWLLAPWDGACTAMLDAVMGFGATQYLSAEEASALLHAWNITFEQSS